MPQPSSNIATPQPGLISTNPFLKANLGTPTSQLTSSPATAGTAGTGGQTLGVTSGTGQSTPVPSGITIAGIPGTSINNKPVVPANTGTAGSALTPQQQLAADQTQLASLQQQQAAQNSGGTNGTGQTFPGYVSTLANTASAPTQPYTQNTNTSEQAQTGLINSIPANSAALQSATQNLQDLQNNYATQQGLIGNSPIGLSEQGGEQGLLNNQYASKLGAAQTAVTNALQNNAQTQTAYNEAGELANTAASNATAQQGNQISGQSAVAGLVQPQAANPYGVYQPASNSFTELPPGNATGGGIAQGQNAAGQTYAQNNAILGKVNSQIPALVSAINSSGYNASPATFVNQLQQWATGNLSNSSIPEVQGSLNDIVGGLSQVLGVPSSGGSDFRLQFAGSIVNALQKGSSIEDALNFAVQQAQAGNAGYLQGAEGNTTPSGGSGGSVSAGGSTFVQNAQGQWVPSS